MHLMSKITVENFRSIKSGEFSLSAYTPLVGYNNAGKTNILRAINWLIKKYSFSAEDFFDPGAPIVVTAELTGINDDVLSGLDSNHQKRSKAF